MLTLKDYLDIAFHVGLLWLGVSLLAGAWWSAIALRWKREDERKLTPLAVHIANASLDKSA